MRKEVIDRLKYLKEQFRTIEMEKVESAHPFITSATYSCRLNNGKIIRRDKLTKGGRDGSAVVIVPINEEEETILVVQPRVFIEGGVGVELPAGYIDEGETPYDAALRELREETGDVPKSLIHLGSYYQDQGVSAAKNHTFLALGCKRLYNQRLDVDEYIEYLSVYYKEALELIDLGEIQDANSILALTRAKDYLRRK